MILVIGSLRFPPENLERLRPYLKDVIRETRAKDGCISYDAAEDVSDRGVIRFSEEWPDEETLARHAQAPHMPVWREACKRLGVSDRKFTLYRADAGRPV